MMGGVTQKNSLTSSWNELGNLLGILKTRIEDIGRTAPRVKAAKVREVLGLGLRPFFIGSEAIARRELIPEVNGMVEGKRPKFEVSLPRPAYRSVDHLRTSEITNGLDEAFSGTVLMMRTNATEANRLVLEGEVSLKFFRGEDAIVGHEGLERKTKVSSLTLEETLTHKSFTASERNLAMIENFA